MPWWKYEKLDAPLAFGSFEDLLNILAEERRKTLKRRKIMMVIIICYLTLIMSLVIFAMMTNRSPGSITSSFGSISAMFAGMYAMSQNQRKGIAALAQFDDIRTVPRLIELLDYQNSEYLAGITGLLERLLPRLQASDAGILSADHHAIINKFLASKVRRKGIDLPLRIAILKALEQIGDSSSLPVVEALAAGQGVSQSQPALREAAEACLPALRLRATHQRETQTLLRASDAVGIASEVLLRPVDGTPVATNPAELLRSVETDPVRGLYGDSSQPTTVQQGTLTSERPMVGRLNGLSNGAEEKPDMIQTNR